MFTAEAVEAQCGAQIYRDSWVHLCISLRRQDCVMDYAMDHRPIRDAYHIGKVVLRNPDVFALEPVLNRLA